MKLLVSVRNPEEALAAMAGGADFIDLKEPGAGALGGLPPDTVRAIVVALRGAGCRLPISATIGDWPMAERAAISGQVALTAACGVDYVKVGILAQPGADRVLDDLARAEATVVPVFIADQPLDAALLAQALADAPGRPGGPAGRGCAFPALMADTADKLGGSLLQRRSVAELQAFVQAIRAAGRLAGLAGALRLADLPALAALAPDFAGFRSAVCEGPRDAPLSAARLAGLRQAATEADRSARPAVSSGADAPSSGARTPPAPVSAATA